MVEILYFGTTDVYQDVFNIFKQAYNVGLLKVILNL